MKTFLTLTAASALALSAHAAAAQKLIYASYMGEVYPIAQTDAWVMDEIEKRTNGELTFERYFGSTLLKAPDVFPGLEQGAADWVSGTPAAYNRDEYRLSNIVLPFVSSDAPAVNEALTKLYNSNEAFQQEFSRHNAHLMYAVPWAENTFWSSSNLAEIGDFEGRRVRAVQAIATAVEKMGGTPVSMTWAEAVEGLTRGVVESVSSTPFDSGILGGVYETAVNGSDGGGMGIFSFAASAMSQSTWDGLSAEHQKVIEEVVAEAPAKYLEILDGELQKAAQKLCDYEGDLTITLFSDAEKQQLRDTVGKEIQQEWVTWAAEGNDVDTQAMLDEYLGYLKTADEASDWKDGFARYSELNCS